MGETIFKISENGIESVVSDGINKSVLKIEKYGVIHISTGEITVCEGGE